MSGSALGPMLGIVLPALLAGMLVSLALVPLGLQVLSRGIVFIDLAVAQIAGLGVICADALGLEPQGWAVQASALGAAVVMVLAFVGAVMLGVFASSMGQASEGSLGAFLATNLVNFLIINVFLAIFNLIPLPPFDGGHVVAGLLPEPLARKWDGLTRFGFPLLILLLLVVPAVFPAANIVQKLVAPPAQALVAGVSKDRRPAAAVSH